MSIRCKECERTGLAHHEHSTPAELKQRRRLQAIENASPSERSALRLEFLLDETKGLEQSIAVRAALIAEARASARLDGETFSVEDPS